MKDALRKKSTQQKFDILSLVRTRGTVSRQQISQRFGIALPTVSSLVRDLQDMGLIRSEGYRRSSGGRPPEVLGIDPNYGVVVGAELRHGRVSAALVDATGELLREDVAGNAIGLDAEQAVEAIGDAIAQQIDAAGDKQVLGIGIGVSGIIEEGGSVSRNFPGSVGWNSVPLADRMELRFGMRPELINDVSAAALGESRTGAWGKDPDIVLFHVGDGIAAGIIWNGKVHRGHTNNAGEVGHVIVAPDGPLCYCGNRGCLESVASRSAVVAKCREAIANGVISNVSDQVDGNLTNLTVMDMLAAARKGDRLTTNLLEEAGTHIGQIGANLVNLLNPSALLLSGIVEEDESPFVDAIRHAFSNMVIPPLRDVTKLEFSRLKQSATVLGAAALVLDATFESPEKIFGESGVDEGEEG